MKREQMNETDVMSVIKARALKAGAIEVDEIALDYAGLRNIEDAIARYPSLTTAEAELYLDIQNDIMPEAVLSAYWQNEGAEDVSFDIPEVPEERPAAKQIDVRHLGERYANKMKGE